MICEGQEPDPNTSGNIVTYQDSICNRCKPILRDVVMKEIGLNRNTEITFNWE